MSNRQQRSRNREQRHRRTDPAAVWSMGLEEYLLDPEVSELMVNNGLAFIDKGGELIEVPVRIDNYKLMAAIEIIGQQIGDQIDEYKKPWLDSRLPDGSRVAAAYPPISPQGVTLTIRKFLRHFTTDELVERRALTSEALDVLVIAPLRSVKTSWLLVAHPRGRLRSLTPWRGISMKLSASSRLRNPSK